MNPDQIPETEARPMLETVELELGLGGSLQTEEEVVELLNDISTWFDLTLFSTQVRQFDPHGITGTGIIGESHIAVHTWPEYEFGHVLVFSCSPLPPLAEIERRFEEREITLLQSEARSQR